MGRACIFSLSLIFLLIACTDQFGVLYVNQILGNSDYYNVYVEDSIFNDNSLLTHFINGLVSCEISARCGVFVESVNYFVGNADVPVDLEVFLNTTINGTFYPDGGIRNDAFPSYGIYSFLLEDNTGSTTMIGELRLYGGIIADGGVFTVAEGTGETFVEYALLKPDGGINVQDGQFTAASEDGTFYTSNYANVEGDFYLGTSLAEDRYITRYPDPTSFGGDTYILGQSSATQGGDIILEPGVGQEQNIGAIILGRAANDNLYFGRPAVDDSGAGGGATFIYGQSTSFGNGGDLIFASGDATAAGNAGDIVLDVGNSQASHGNIIVGNTGAAIRHDLYLYRPTTSGTPGGATYISGQTTSQGDAGNLYLKAGGVSNVLINALYQGTPGDINLIPGQSLQEDEQGDIVLGRSTPVTLYVLRYPVLAGLNIAEQAGSTTWLALNGDVGVEGGDFYLQAGDAGNYGNGGDVYLKLGDLPTSGVTITNPGVIYWGTESTPQALTVTRASSIGAGAATYIIGQKSDSFNGGILRLQGGTGTGNSGSLSITAGSGSLSDGGSVSITGGDGDTAGGSISFTAGSGTTTPGTVTFNGGSATGSAAGGQTPTGGSIYLNAGSGSSLGQVLINNANQLTIETNAVTLYDYLQIQQGSSGDQLVIQADPVNIVSFNGDTLIKDRIFNVQNVDTTTLVAPNPVEPYYTFPIIQRIQNIIDTTQDLINALSQCGHGLMTTVDAAGNPDLCNLPGPVPTPIVRPTP